MKNQLTFSIQICAEQDTETGVIRTVKCDVSDIKVTPINGVSAQVLHTLNDSEVRYGYIIVGAGNELGRCIPKGSTMLMRCRGDDYEVTTHKTTKSRIDSLSKLFRKNPDFKEGETLRLKYDSENKIIICEPA